MDYPLIGMLMTPILALIGYLHLRLNTMERISVSKDVLEMKLEALRVQVDIFEKRLDRIEVSLDRLSDKIDKLLLKE